MLSACLCLPSNRCDAAAVQFLEVFRGNSQASLAIARSIRTKVRFEVRPDTGFIFFGSSELLRSSWEVRSEEREQHVSGPSVGMGVHSLLYSFRNIRQI